MDDSIGLEREYFLACLVQKCPPAARTQCPSTAARFCAGSPAGGKTKGCIEHLGEKGTKVRELI